MKKVAVYIVFVGVLCLSAFGQATQPAQPQASPTPARTAPALSGNVPPSNSGQPPVIRGGAGPLSTTPPATMAPTTNPPAAKPTPSKDDEIIKVETNLVTTPVSVLDRNGRFIPGLKQKDFKIFENDIPQKITYFQSEEQPFTVVLLIDISPSTKYKIDEIHFAAVTFVNQLRSTDKVMVVAFDQRIRILTEPTSDKQQLYAAIYKAQFGSGTSLYEAVDYVANLDMINATGRKAIVLFTDGVDTTSRRANFQSTIAAVQEVDALVYPIRYNTQTDPVAATAAGRPVALPADIAALLAARGITIDPRMVTVAGRGQSQVEYERGRQYLDALAQNSGGRMFDAGTITNLQESFAGIAQELRQQYSIGYYPEADGQPGERRRVKIKVVKPNLVVRAKTGYVIRQPRGQAGSIGQD